jgi:hypothetical protein
VPAQLLGRGVGRQQPQPGPRTLSHGRLRPGQMIGPLAASRSGQVLR